MDPKEQEKIEKAAVDKYVADYQKNNGFTPDEAVEKILALEEQVEQLKTADTRSSKADPLGSVKIPKGSYLIVEQIRYEKENLGPSTAKNPVISDLKKLDKETIQRLLDRGTIR